MLAGLIVFVLGKPSLLGRGEAPAPLARRPSEWSLYGVGLAAVAVIWALVQYQDVIQIAADHLRASRCSLYVLYEAFKLEPQAARPHFRDPVPDRPQPAVLGPVRAGRRHRSTSSPTACRPRRAFPPSLFQSINPIYIILLAPLFAGLWTCARQARARAVGTGQVRPGAAPGRRSASWCSSGARRLSAGRRR